jgi:hypothetical protein
MFSSLKDKITSFSDDQRLERLKQCMDIQLALDECERVASIVDNAKRGSNSEIDFQQEEASSTSSTSTWRKKIWNKSASSDGDATQPQKDIIEEDPEPKIRLEDTRSGMKMNRYFEWGLVNHKAQAAIAEMRENGAAWSSLRPSSSDAQNDSTNSTMNDTTFDATLDNSTSFENSTIPSSSSSPSCSCPRETHALWGCRAMAFGCAPDLVEMKKCFKNKLGTTNPSSLHYEDSEDNIPSSSCGLEQKKLADCVLKNWTEMNERLDRRDS